MSRFRFRLQGLLRLRTQLEQVARRSLATAMGAVASVEQRMAVADAGLRECEQLGCTNAPQAPVSFETVMSVGQVKVLHEGIGASLASVKWRSLRLHPQPGSFAIARHRPNRDVVPGMQPGRISPSEAGKV